MLLASGILLCAGGLLMLAAASSTEDTHIAGGTGFFLLISVVPGISLVVIGMLLKTGGQSKLIDVLVLGLSIAWVFLLTLVPIVIEIPEL